jgi:endonuclease YncB( thermonuclease family)
MPNLPTTYDYAATDCRVVYEAGVTPSLNETMVAAGLAVAWDGRGKKPE